MDYQSQTWKRKRASILKRDFFRCVECKRFGKLRDANTVHHIFPCEYFPQYEWESWNMISLCAICHNTMHDRDTHQLTARGWQVLERAGRKNNISVSDSLKKIIVKS